MGDGWAGRYTAIPPELILQTTPSTPHPKHTQVASSQAARAVGGAGEQLAGGHAAVQSADPNQRGLLVAMNPSWVIYAFGFSITIEIALLGPSQPLSRSIPHTLQEQQSWPSQVTSYHHLNAVMVESWSSQITVIISNHSHHHLKTVKIISSHRYHLE